MTPVPSGAFDLSRELLADHVRRAHDERWSGVMQLVQGQVTKKIYVLNGDLALAASTLEEDRLGAQLYRSGKITEAQFHAALRTATGTGRHIGGALRRAGVLTADELLVAVSAQLERIVLSVLRWTSGTLLVEPLPDELPTRDPIGLDPRPLLLVGMRHYPSAERLSAAVGAAERHLARARPAPFDVESLPPLPAERAVLALCTRGCRLSRLLGLPHDLDDVLRALYGLLASGLLVETRPR